MMNRQIRRAQEKQERKVDKEREKRRDARREKVQRLREQRSRSREAARKRREQAAASRASGASSDDGDTEAGADGAKVRAKGANAPSGAAPAKGRKPGRFSGVLMMATVFFIVLQAAVPADETGADTLRTITSAGFYLLFGYFSTLWLMRRATPRPIMMTMISGVMLTAGVEVAKRFQPEVTTDLLLLALAIPAIAAGAFLGRLVYTNTPG